LQRGMITTVDAKMVEVVQLMYETNICLIKYVSHKT
jgi:hypothetical protein